VLGGRAGPYGGTMSKGHEPAASPVLVANAGRNAKAAGQRRRARWRPAADAAWALLSEHIAPGDRVAVVGAGNGDDLPLRRLAGRAGTLDLIDLDARALRRARRRCRLTRAAVGTRALDVTGGRADAIVGRALGRPAPTTPPDPPELPQYDVIVADLMYTQLLYPALADARVPGTAVDRILLEEGQRLTNAVVERLHAAAPGGLVIHLHDLLGWWEGHPQPFTLQEVLELGARDPQAALTLAARGNVPYGCDPRAASARLGAEVLATAFWHWPFNPATDYLVCATVTRSLRAPP
jgi:hypothetical protein